MSAFPSEPEDVLDLLPDGERDEERQEDEPEEEEEEPDPRPAELLLVLHAGAALRARERKPAFDRDRVDGRVFLRTPMRGWGPDGQRC